jgi:NitT/TauT family transport system substrate-binding protein
MNRKQIWAGFLALVIVLGIGLVGPSAAMAGEKPLKKVVFLTNYVFHGRHSPFFVGLDKGFYKEAGLDIHIAPATGSGFVLAAIEGGKADYGMAESTSVVQVVAKGGKAKGFAVFMDVTTSGLASLTPYPTPETLAGKTVAASLTDSARVILPIIFNLKKLNPESIKWQTVDPSVYFPLLLEGKVDLFTASIDGDVPALMKVAAPLGKTVQFSSFADWGYDVFGYFLVTTGEKLANNPDEVKAFAAATVKAVKYSIEHPEETAQIMVKYNPTLDYNTTLAQWQQSIKAINTPYVKQNGYGIATTDRLQRTVNLVKEAFKLTGTLVPNDIYTGGFVSR